MICPDNSTGSKPQRLLVEKRSSRLWGEGFLRPGGKFPYGWAPDPCSAEVREIEVLSSPSGSHQSRETAPKALFPEGSILREGRWGWGQGLELGEASQHSGHRVEGALPAGWVPPHTETGVSLHFSPWCLACFSPVLPWNWGPVPQLHPGQKELPPPLPPFPTAQCFRAVGLGR